MRIWWRQTTWVVLVPITTHIPSFINVAHTELWIFDFLLLANQKSYANEVLNMCIQWQQTTWVVLVLITTHIPNFINVAHTELWIFDFMLLANLNRYANEVLNMVMTNHVGSTCAPPLPTYQVWRKSVRAFSFESQGLPFDVDEIWHTYIHLYIQTALQMKTKWSFHFQHSWQPTKITNLRS